MKYVFITGLIIGLAAGLTAGSKVQEYQSNQLQQRHQIELGCGQYNSKTGEFEDVSASGIEAIDPLQLQLQPLPLPKKKPLLPTK